MKYDDDDYSSMLIFPFESPRGRDAAERADAAAAGRALRPSVRAQYQALSTAHVDRTGAHYLRAAVHQYALRMAHAAADVQHLRPGPLLFGAGQLDSVRRDGRVWFQCVAEQ